MRCKIYKKQAKVQINWDAETIYNVIYSSPKQKNRREYPTVSTLPCCQEKVVGAERFTSYISRTLNGEYNLFMRCILPPPLHSSSQASFDASLFVGGPVARKWLWALRDSNSRPPGCKPDALNQLS